MTTCRESTLIYVQSIRLHQPLYKNIAYIHKKQTGPETNLKHEAMKADQKPQTVSVLHTSTVSWNQPHASCRMCSLWFLWLFAVRLVQELCYVVKPVISPALLSLQMCTWRGCFWHAKNQVAVAYLVIRDIWNLISK